MRSSQLRPSVRFLVLSLLQVRLGAFLKSFCNLSVPLTFESRLSPELTGYYLPLSRNDDFVRLFRRIAGYVEQQDMHSAVVTVKEVCLLVYRPPLFLPGIIK